MVLTASTLYGIIDVTKLGKENDMKQLADIKYPDDFTNPECAVAGDETISKLINLLKMGNHEPISTADAMVILTPTGNVEVYKLVASCEVEIEETVKW